MSKSTLTSRQHAVTIKICFEDEPSPESDNKLETFRRILENAAVNIVLERYMQQIEERKNGPQLQTIR